MSNPDWSPSMASWNFTTSCKEWTEDWRPCDFPYTGLEGYYPNADHCFETFAESLPDTYLYDIGRIIFAVMYLPIFLTFAHRVTYMLVDLGLCPFSVPCHAVHGDFKRKSRTINIHDQCNVLSLLGSGIQLVCFFDLHAWQDVIAYTVYRVLGRLVRSMIVTTAIIIIKIWMNLISFWTSSTSDSFKSYALQRDIKLMNICIVLTWVVLLPVEMYAILYTRDNCHEGCTNARVSCISGIIISVLTLVAMALASRYVYLTKGLFHKIKTEGVHGVFSARFKESDDVLGDARSSSVASSIGDRPSVMAPFHIRPSTDNICHRQSDEASERTTSDFSVRNTDVSLSADLRNISENLVKDMDAIIWKRIRQLSIFIIILYIAAIGSAYADAMFCATSMDKKFDYSSPPCANKEVFTHDGTLYLTLLFYIAVALYIPTRYRVMAARDFEEEETTADAVIRQSEHGQRSDRPSTTRSTLVSIIF